MDKTNNNDPFDLGSEPMGDDFDPFATNDNDTVAKSTAAQKPKSPGATVKASAVNVPDNAEQDITDKLPVFEYAGATEDIDDVSKTFEELRIAKAADFPELEDGKRVSWTLEYGKTTRTVADPKGVTIGKMKADIETSKDFLEALKKAKDKNPVCKVKPRVTAQSKGTVPAYKGVFTNMDEVNAAGKVISIVPAKDGKVYEVRSTDMGKFITPVIGCDMLSEVRAGFVPALPRIPSDLMMKVVAFFRYFTRHGADNEALLNIYWDKQNEEYIIDAPEQIVSKVSVNSRISDDFSNDRYIHYMDIHSHNTMRAFFSSVDDADEKATRLYMVIGKLHECIPEIRTRISNGGKFLDIDPVEVIEPIGKSFPDEWKDKVRFRSSHDEDKRGAFAQLLTTRDKLLEVGGDYYAVCA